LEHEREVIHAIKRVRVVVAKRLLFQQILLGVQDLLTNPNPASSAQANAYNVFRKDQVAYMARIKEIVRNNPAWPVLPLLLGSRLYFWTGILKNV